MRCVGIAVGSKQMMQRVYVSNRRRCLARLRFTRYRRGRDCGGCGVECSRRGRRRLRRFSPFSKGPKSFWMRFSKKSNMFLSVIVRKQASQYVSICKSNV